ncbi:unnamed protein product [Linum tenue]|uniref:Uncharacterized protein n=2 Tax=Linum tenue TaxID=586396 RepID=A0AAV0HCB7_9ROSI|nr:unnamed protein product [Linum tenue]CAI0382828.1 unnamed protein product [Linum tenue]
MGRKPPCHKEITTAQETMTGTGATWRRRRPERRWRKLLSTTALPRAPPGEGRRPQKLRCTKFATRMIAGPVSSSTHLMTRSPTVSTSSPCHSALAISRSFSRTHRPSVPSMPSSMGSRSFVQPETAGPGRRRCLMMRRGS